MSETKSITITKLDESDPAALYHHYQGQTNPQDCYLELDPTERTLRADWNGEVGNAVPFSVFHGRIYRYSIPCLTATAANKLMERVSHDAALICDGYSEEWDGSNFVGHLMNGAPREAHQKLEDLINTTGLDYYYDDDDMVNAWDAGDWLAGIGTTEQQADELKITSATTNEDLEKLEKELKTEALSDGVHVLRDLYNHLESIRDEDERGTPS